MKNSSGEQASLAVRSVNAGRSSADADQADQKYPEDEIEPMTA